VNAGITADNTSITALIRHLAKPGPRRRPRATRRYKRALLAGLAIGVLEALLGGYVSAEYGDTVLYAILAALVLAWPRGLGFEPAVGG
jgi:hypothetical protein